MLKFCRLPASWTRNHRNEPQNNSTAELLSPAGYKPLQNGVMHHTGVRCDAVGQQDWQKQGPAMKKSTNHINYHAFGCCFHVQPSSPQQRVEASQRGGKRAKHRANSPSKHSCCWLRDALEFRALPLEIALLLGDNKLRAKPLKLRLLET